MSNTETHRVGVDAGRRQFLKGMAVAGGAATVGATAGGAAADMEPDSPITNEPQSKQGYRVTAHILDYYRTAGL